MLLALLLVIFGCQETNQDAVAKNNEVAVVLTCIQKNDCEDHKFNDLESFQVFKTALDSANKMQGILNYSAEYNLSITFQDQSTKKFHLSLGTNREMKGLLVNLENTNQGYEISITQANKLRDLIESK